MWEHIVQEKLFYRIPCEECGSPVEQIKKTTSGSLLNVKLYCINEYLFFSWDSQPTIGDKMPTGNLLMSAATLFTGQTYSHIAEFADVLNLQYFSKTTYYDIQKRWLIPTINKQWEEDKSLVKDEILSRDEEDGKLQLAGDGRCDSPGYSAKYL